MDSCSAGVLPTMSQRVCTVDAAIACTINLIRAYSPEDRLGDTLVTDSITLASISTQMLACYSCTTVNFNIALYVQG